MKIKSLLITIMAGFVILPATAFAVTANIQMQEIAMTNYVNTTSELAEKQALGISEYFDILSRTAAQIADSPYITSFTKNNDESVIKDYLAEYAAIIDSDNNPSPLGISRIIVADKTGASRFDTDSEVENNDIFKSTVTKLLEKNAPGGVYLYASDIFFEDGDMVNQNDPIFQHTSAISSEVKLVVRCESGDYNVIVFFSDSELKSFGVATQFTNNSRLILVDPYRSIYDSAYLGNADDASYGYYGKLIGSAKLGTPTQVNNFKGDDANSIPTIGFTIKVPNDRTETNSNWVLSVVAETERAYTTSGNALGAIIGVIVLITVLMMIGGIILVFAITKPIKLMEETLVKVRRGDHEARINVISNNEYGQISRAFNDLIDDIVVSEGRYRTIIEMSDNIIFEWNFKTNEVTFSNNFNKKFSYRAPSDHFGDSFLLKVKVHPDDSERYHKDLEQLSKGQQFAGNEYRWKNIYGDFIWILMRTATIRDADGNIARVVGVIVDIDRAKKSEKMLTERASYDSLTGLYNRETIERTIDNEIEMVSIRKSECAILFIDVDDFKIYNDKYSHATGDQVLNFVGTTIASIVEGCGTAGRYGGDEFVVCIRNIDVNDPAEVAKKMLNTLKAGFVADNGEHLSVNTSIGISIVNNSSMSVEEIVGKADDAMYRIKKSGKSNYGFLTNDAITQATPDTVIEEDYIGGTAPEEPAPEGPAAEENEE